MKALARNVNLLMLVIGGLALLGGSVYAMTQVTRAVPATVTVEVMPGVIAEPILLPFQDPVDETTGVRLGIVRVYDSGTGEDVVASLASFQSRMTYDGSCINILELRPMDFTATALDIDNDSGVTTFDGVASPPVETPSNLYHAVSRLVGSNKVPCAVTADLDFLLDDGGNQVLVPDTSLQDLLRGDARADGVINIADALFTAEYSVGLRDVCTSDVDTTCLHSLNAASVRQDGSIDRKTIADALFMAQYLAGLRDEFFNLVPSPDVVAELGKEFRLGIGNTAIFELESLKLTFLEVSEDSRCPSDVVCVWEGQATVVVDLSARGQRLGSFDLTLGAGREELATQHAGQYRLTLVGLEPYPISTHQIQPQEYQATLVIDLSNIRS